MAPDRAMRLTDREVIDVFVAFLAANGRPGLVVTDHPEDHKDGEIDAVAGDLAIEHTSIDTLRNQRRDSDWFTRLIADLEQEVPKPKVPAVDVHSGGGRSPPEKLEAAAAGVALVAAQRCCRRAEGRRPRDRAGGLPGYAAGA